MDRLELLTLVSNTPTPKEFIEQKQGIDYVKVEYMKYILNRSFAPWSWDIKKTEIIKDGEESYVLVVGRLTYTINGNQSFIDVPAAHRIQYSKIKDKNGTIIGRKLTDPGNDIKAAGTDAFKKACNMGLNIADDVYRSRVVLSGEEKEKIIKSAKDEEKNIIIEKINNLKINANNYKRELAGVLFRSKK